MKTYCETITELGTQAFHEYMSGNAAVGVQEPEQARIVAFIFSVSVKKVIADIDQVRTTMLSKQTTKDHFYG
jgi:hypothetical protein